MRLLPRTAVALVIAIAACTTAPPAGDAVDDDPVVTAAVAQTARRVAPGDVEIVVHAGHTVRAELRPDRSLHVWRGLLLRARDGSELAFALAHERAHDALGHAFPRRGAARDIGQELAADAEAQRALATAGFDPSAGATLLQALRDEAAAAAGDAAAIRELDRRIAAFGTGRPRAAPPADDPWRPTWLARRAGWLAADPASADPRRRDVVARHAGVAAGAH